MKLLILLIFSTATILHAEEPRVVFDSAPDSGLPADAARQDQDSTIKNDEVTLSSLVSELQFVQVRYTGPEWKSQQEAQKYLLGLLSDASIKAQRHVFWSEGFGYPEMECYLDIGLGIHGRLYLWGRNGCILDGSGRWWFFRLTDYHRTHHPQATR